MKINVAFNRDCMDAMKEFSDGFFDLAVVDPPYGIGITNTAADDSQSVHVERERESRTTTMRGRWRRALRW